MRTTLGPTEFFSGAMAAVITKKVKKIIVIADATFTTLTMQWPPSPTGTGAVAPTTLTFLAAAKYEIEDVASFRLATGAIQVIYHHNA